MNDRPLISIVLPTFNGSRFLRDAIQSCVAQTYQRWELIIVDDASTDSTPEIVSEWLAKDKRIRALRNETNIKLPASLNRGFREARGEYLTWTSDDNLYEPKALEEMLAVLLGDPKAGLVYADFSEIDDLHELQGSVKVGENYALAYDNCVRACFLYCREVYSQVGDYDETMFLVEDWDYWLRALKHFKLVTLHKNLYRYRRHGNSLTTTREESVKKAVEKLLSHHLCDASLFPRAARAKGYIKLLQFALDRGDRRSARSYFAAALLCSPHLALHGRRSLAVSLFLGEKLSSMAAAFARVLRWG